MGRSCSIDMEGRCSKRGTLWIETALAGQPRQRCYVAMMSQMHDGHYVTAICGYRVRVAVPANRRAAFLGCSEKTAKSEGIVKPAAIQMRSPDGESQCGNIEWERCRGAGNDGDNAIGGAVCQIDKVERRSSEDDCRRTQAFTCGWRWAK